jgi:preprotein translocase subunit SecG
MTEQPRYTLALEEARRSMDQQMADLAGIRARATTLLGVAGLSASFLGGLALRDDPALSRYTWVAIGAFIAVTGVCLAILWPRAFRASRDPAKLVAWAELDDTSSDQMDRDLALWIGKQYDGNVNTLNRLMWLYCGAVVVLLIEIAALVLDLRTR